MEKPLTQLAPFRLPEAPARQDLVAKYFRALGDPTRLRIPALLDAEGELSAGELTRRLGLAQPKVSNHLACCQMVAGGSRCPWQLGQAPSTR
jgi:DNA-binding transcriptional ArsR family regulator